MAQTLSEIELRFVDSFTGMSTGYVLDFSNRTFASFFASEVGIDIYEDRFAFEGNSKGKRLRAFLTAAPPSMVGKALRALWLYYLEIEAEHGRTADTRKRLRRLNNILVRLKCPEVELGPDRVPEVHNCPSVKPDLGAIRAGFESLHVLEPHQRGYAFERFLASYFEVWGMAPRDGFRREGEQIDGSLQHDGQTYLIEAKWHQSPTSIGDLNAFQGKVEAGPSWGRGLFISYMGFTQPALKAFVARRVILMDGLDLSDALQRELPMTKVLEAKARHAVEMSNPFARVRTLFRENAHS